LIERSWELLPAVIERINALAGDRIDALAARVWAAPVRPTSIRAVPLPERGR
jgi:hypothetical protein